MDFMQQKADALTQSRVFSGIEWRVDQNAKVLFSGRSGSQDVETGSQIPDKAIYRIYSMTKPIVCACVDPDRAGRVSPKYALI